MSHFVLRIYLNAESVLEETNKNLKERELYLEECEKRMNEMSDKIHHLQSTLSTMKVFPLPVSIFSSICFIRTVKFDPNLNIFSNFAPD